MRKRSNSTSFTNQRGIALITVLLVMLVLTILATGAVAFGVSNYNQSKKTDEHSQAYYVAEAGVNFEVQIFETKISELILDNNPPEEILIDLDEWIATSSSNQQTLSTVNGKARSFTAAITRNSYTINITSTGTIGTVSRTLTKKIRLNGLLINKAILTSGTLNINKTDVFLDASGNYGLVQTLSNTAGSVNIDKLGQINEISIPTPVPPTTFENVIQGCTVFGPISDQKCQTGSYTYKVIYDDSITTLPKITIPTQPLISQTTDLLLPVSIDSKTNQLVSSTGVLSISSNSVNSGYIYTMASSNSPKINFYTPKFEIIGTVSNFVIDIGDKDIAIIAAELDLSGSFKIQGSGTLTVFVTSDNFHYNCGNGDICGVQGNKILEVSDQFIIVLTGANASTLDLSNNTGNFYMSLITNQNVNLSMQGNGTFNGFLATSGSNITFKGTASSNMLIYAPNAIVNITGNTAISGAIIAESYQNLNSASTSVTYNPAFSNPPFDFLNPFSNLQYDPTIES